MWILEEDNENQKNLSGQLGYFLGSFDPLHDGHVAVVQKIFSERLCNNILVYCVNGQGTYKNRSDFRARTDFCVRNFKNFENVIISYLAPRALQQKLTIPDGKNVVLASSKVRITAIIGSDIIKNLYKINNNIKIEQSRRFLLKNYMRGLVIGEDFQDSIACAVMLPAEDFIVALRENDKFSDIPGKICGKKVRAVIDLNEVRWVSSSKIRNHT